MATIKLSVGSLLNPDTSGNVYWQPTSILDTNDLYPTQEVLIFADTATLDKAHGNFLVPNDYVGTAVLTVRCKFATITTGNVLFTLDYRSIAATEAGDPSTHQESLAGSATAVPGTANLIADISFSLTSANLAAGDTFMFTLARNGAGADTAAASAQVIDVIFTYANA